MAKLYSVLLLVVLFTFLMIYQPVYAGRKSGSTTTTTSPEPDKSTEGEPMYPILQSVLNAPSNGCPPGQRMDRGRCRTVIQ